MLFSPSFKVLSGYFYVSLNLTGILYFFNSAEFRDTGPLNLSVPSVAKGKMQPKFPNFAL